MFQVRPSSKLASLSCPSLLPRTPRLPWLRHQKHLQNPTPQWDPQPQQPPLPPPRSVSAPPLPPSRLLSPPSFLTVDPPSYFLRCAASAHLRLPTPPPPPIPSPRRGCLLPSWTRSSSSSARSSTTLPPSATASAPSSPRSSPPPASPPPLSSSSTSPSPSQVQVPFSPISLLLGFLHTHTVARNLVAYSGTVYPLLSSRRRAREGQGAGGGDQGAVCPAGGGPQGVPWSVLQVNCFIHIGASISRLLAIGFWKEMCHVSCLDGCGLGTMVIGGPRHRWRCRCLRSRTGWRLGAYSCMLKPRRS